MNTPVQIPSDDTPDLAAMSPAHLLERLVREEDRAPLALIDACASHGEAMVALLREVIDGEPAWRGDVLGEWWLLLHAACILGRIPSEAAGALLVRLMRRMDEYDDDDLQDWLAGGWPALFADKPHGAVAAARALAEDSACGAYIRTQAADVVLAAGLHEGSQALESAIDWLAALVGDTAGDAWFREMGAMTLLDFPRERHHGLLRAIAAEEAQRRQASGGMVGTFTGQDIDEVFRHPRDEPHWFDPWRFYDPDAIAERQRRWQQEARRETVHSGWQEVTTYVRTTPKTGRNDPCPCGSGKKYKRCCLSKDGADP